MPRVFFSSRHGGSSSGPYASLNLGTHVLDSEVDVAKNRETLRHHLSLPQLLFMNQSHGAEIATIDNPSALADVYVADAIMTNLPGVGLAVMVADCVPLLVASDEWVAAVHVGRVGLLKGIVESVLAQFQARHSSITRAWIGPHICSQCYEVSPDMYADAVNQQSHLATSPTAHCLDLQGAVSAILATSGGSLSVVDSCTVENSDFFSYRRDTVTGRFAGVISL